MSFLSLFNLLYVSFLFNQLIAFEVFPSKFIIKGSNDVYLPLKSIKNDIIINEGIAKVSITQEYHNDKNIALETEYYFPINPDAVFDQFEAILAEKIIFGYIKEKNQAKKEHQDNLNQGNIVAYSEIDPTAHDIMHVNVGNILPNQTIFIRYSYIEPLELVLNKFKRFTLYATLTPRYNPVYSNVQDLPINTISANMHTYKSHIYVNLTSNKPLNTLYSPSHKIQISNNYEKHRNLTLITIDPTESHDPNKDFVLIFQENDPFEPKITIETHPIYKNSRIAVINFFPELNALTNTEASAFLNKNTKNLLISDIENSKGEFFFIIDRSGSMEGLRIQNLKKALQVFLKSLPNDSYFNIISFGSNYEALFKSEQSVRYNEENLKIALDSIEKYNSDMGGTEIFYPLEMVISSKIKSQYPKLVFLLTDGNVGNGDQIIEMIKKQLGFSRIYTVGIGNGISPSFIKGMAEAGKGKCEFVKDDDILEEKAINLLHSSISPFARNVDVTFNKLEFIKELIPKTNKINFLLKNEMFQFFLFFKEFENVEILKDLQIIITYENSFTEKKVEYIIPYSEIKFIDNSDIFHKLAIKKKISIMEENIIETMNKEIEEEIIQNSIKFQVLCEKTAFITVIQENSDFNGDLVKNREKIRIDNINSIDYDGNTIKSNHDNAGYDKHYKTSPSSSGFSPFIQRMFKNSFAERNSFIMLGVILFCIIAFLAN